MAIDFSWFIAVGIVIGLSLILDFLSEEKMSLIGILVYMCIIDSFIVSAGLLPLWTVILFMLIVVGMTIMKVKGVNNAYNN